jgi:hypothetical protein
MAEQTNNNQNSTPSKTRKPRRSNKQKAEDQFDFNAKPKSLEKFFSEVIEQQRENVEIELHLDVEERITDGYTERIESFVEFSNLTKDEKKSKSTDLIADINAITDIAIAKKLWTSTPESEKTAVESQKYLRTLDVQLPKAVNIAVDQVGKVTTEDWVCRIKHNSLTIDRFLFRALQQAAHDTSFYDRHLSNSFADEVEKKKFLEQDVAKLFTSSLDSVEFLREYSTTILDEIMSRPFEVKVGTQDHIITVCYPQLKFIDDDKIDRESIIKWMSTLTVNHPNWETAADAAILRLVNLPWLEKRDKPLKDLDPVFRDSIWKDRKLNQVLEQLKLQHLDDYKKLKVRNRISDFLFWYQKMTVPTFKRMFNMSTMSMSSSFGSKAQLIVSSDFEKSKKLTGEFFTVAPSAEGSSYFRLKEKGSIVQNMIYGFTRAIKLKENYKYRLNGSPSSIKASNIASDLRE